MRSFFKIMSCYGKTGEESWYLLRNVVPILKVKTLTKNIILSMKKCPTEVP